MEPVTKRIRFDTIKTDSDVVTPHSREDILKETDAGITIFLNQHSNGFHCILKKRWEDFIVREVLDGVPAVLSTVTNEDLVEAHDEATEFGDVLYSYLDELEALSCGKGDTIQIKAPEDKIKRTVLHKAIHARFPDLTSSTIKTENDNLIIVSKMGKKQTYGGVVIPKRAAIRLPDGLPYCRFVLYKEGKDTISAVQLLGRYLHVNPSHFGYAGTKDRRAITTQFLTVKGVESKRLALLNQRLHGIRVGNFSYVSSPIFLGALDGNQFTLVLRSISISDVELDNFIEFWRNHGFVNYYGLQRFGHSAQSTSFEIGKYLILSNWTQAIGLILRPTSADLPVVRQVKQEFESNNNATESASRIPLCAEKSLLLGVSKHGKSLNALQSLPRHLLQLYVHSYQSLIWNRIASRRIEELGINDFHAVPGDLYFPTESISELYKAEVVPEELDAEVVDQNVEDPEEGNPSRLEVSSVPREPCVATEADCATVPLTQVVLPLPGYAVRYPENASGAWYKEYLAQDGLTMENLKHRVKNLALPGSYRPLIVKPRDVSYEIRTYTDPTIPLVQSDRQKLEGVESVRQQSISESKNSDTTPVNDIPSTEMDLQRAVVLTLSLPKSSYATMAVRELTKSGVVEQR